MEQKRRELSNEVKAQIVILHEDHTMRQISDRLSLPLSTVGYVIKKFEKTGSYENKDRKGRPKKLSARNEIYILRELKKNPHQSLRQLSINIGNCVPQISIASLSNFVKSRNYTSRIAVEKPLLNLTHIKTRINYCKRMATWSKDQLDKIIYSDESSFCLYSNSHCKRVWRLPGTRYQSQNVLPKVKFGGGKIMVWGCITRDGVGPLISVKGHINQESYKKILEDHFLPWFLSLPNGYVFQEDNAPVHNGHMVTTWRQEQQIEKLDWPPQSPDLSPIENLWDLLDRLIRKVNPQPKTLPELEKIIKLKWLEIRPEIVRKLYDSVPKRIALCLKVKGGHTKY